MGKEIYPFFCPCKIDLVFIGNELSMKHQAIMSIKNLNTWNYTLQEIKEVV
jgi:hypothetical protein